MRVWGNKNLRATKLSLVGFPCSSLRSDLISLSHEKINWNFTFVVLLQHIAPNVLYNILTNWLKGKDFDALKKDWIKFSWKKFLAIIRSWQDNSVSKCELPNWLYQSSWAAVPWQFSNYTTGKYFLRQNYYTKWGYEDLALRMKNIL